MKYGQAKYNTFKYGRYKAIPKAIGKAVRYRINDVVTQKITIDGNMQELRIRSDSSTPIVNQHIVIEGDIKRVRLRSDTSGWTISNRITLEEMDQ